MVEKCDRCGARMSLVDHTTKVLEYRCPECHSRRIDWKDRRRAVESP